MTVHVLARQRRPLLCLFASLALLAALPLAAVERVSVGTGGNQGNGQSRFPAISGNGRYIAFESDATTLVPGDSNGSADIFVRDLLLGTTTRVSLTQAGQQASAASQRPQISGDGSRLVFGSFGQLLPDSGYHNCYLLDRNTGLVTLIDRRLDTGVPASEVCQSPSIDLSGTRVAFGSRNANLIPAGLDSNGWADVFVRDLVAGSTTRVNLGPGGIQADADVFDLRIAGGGGHVLYTTPASTLVAGDSNGVRDVFVSTLAGATTRVSVGPGGSQPSAASGQVAATNLDASIMAFSNSSPNLPDWAPNVESTLYLRVPSLDATIAVSVPLSPSLPREGFSEEPDLSATGRWLVFWSSDQLIPGPVNTGGIYVIDLAEGLIDLVSLTPGGTPASGNHFGPRISADGSVITWFSNSTVLVPGDDNGTWDVFATSNPIWDDTLFANGFDP